MIWLCYQALFCSSGMNSILFLILEISWTLPRLQNRLMEVKSKRYLQHRWLMRSCQEVSTQKQELPLKWVAKHSRVTHDGWLRPKLILKSKFNRKTSVIQKFMNQSETCLPPEIYVTGEFFSCISWKPRDFSETFVHKRTYFRFPLLCNVRIVLKICEQNGIRTSPPLSHLLPSPDNLAGLNF